MVRVYLARLPKNEAVYNEATQKKATHKEQSVWAHKLLDMALEREYPGLTAPVLLEKDEHGKPFLVQYPQIQISLSHSGGYAACAIGEKPVGVDIEMWKNCRKRERIVEKLHPAEQKIYSAAAEEERERLFFDFWVLKESFGKAVGKGLGIPLSASCMQSVYGETGEVSYAAGSAEEKKYFCHLYKIGGEDMSLAACSEESEFAEEPVWLTVPEEF